MADQTGKPKILIVYYSHDGNTAFIAESIAEALEADILELRPRRIIKSKDFMKFTWGEHEVVMQMRPELDDLDKDPHRYDIIFLGTPVWAWSFAPPLRTFFAENEL